MKNSIVRSLVPVLGLVWSAAAGSAQTVHSIAATPAAGQHMIINQHGPGVGLPVHPSEPTTFLGVSTGRVDSTLTEQLGLQRDAGLIVASVLPDSPAAGQLRRHDILLKLNDQILVNTEQLGVLVRSFKEGDEITLTFMRGGKQETTKVKLSQRLAPRVGSWSAGSDVWQQFVPPSGATMTQGAVQLRQIPGALAGTDINRTLALVNPNFTFSTGAVPVARMADVGRSNLVFSDDAGSLELKLSDGKKELVAKDPSGAVLFSGPINTDDERKAMPEAVRARLEKMEGIDTLRFQVGDDFKPGDVRVIAPRAEGIRLERAVQPSEGLRVL